MSILKKIVSILSVFCIIALLIYGIIASPILAGYKPWSVKDDSLGKDFPKNSLFYYKATEFTDIETNYAIVYSNTDGKHIGIVKSVNEDAGTVDIWTKIGTNAQGKNEGQISVTIKKDYILGMAKSMNFAFIGGYFAYINNHIAITVLMGVILALRIMFIYVDPDKNSAKNTEESESFEQKFNSVLKKEKAPISDVDSIFGERKKEEVLSEPVAEESDAADMQNFEEDHTEEPVNEVLEEEPVKFFEKKTELKEEVKEETSIPDANEITNYINELAFDSKDDAWYNADQVDKALDMITAKVYSALSAIQSSETSAELDKLREQSAEAEKKYLTAEAELAKANEEIEKYEKEIEDYKKQIEAYKLMEQKVAKLVSAIRENKKNV